ncbi:hypothetical protein ACFL45_04525 [Candidatus Neomarinimicrobiota bacterium]
MSEAKLIENMRQLGEGIQACLDKKLYTSALILIYSAIDITGWLASTNPKAKVRKRFTNWVDSYLLSAKELGCTSLELYSARCGLVHTFTPDSKIVESEKVRRIAYAWGEKKSSDLQKLIEKTGWSDRLVAVRVEDLYEAWRLGLVMFIHELKDNQKRAEVVYTRASKFYDQIIEGTKRV